jgi:hypothetical protein
VDVDVTIKQGTLGPPLQITCLDRNGLPVSLAGATAVFRFGTLWGESPIWERTAAVTDADAGEMEYDWQSGDTDTPGTYKGVFIATFGSMPMAFPSDGFLVIKIESSMVA